MRSAVGLMMGLVIGLAAGSSHATDANLDPSFGTFGWTSVDLLPGQYETGTDVAIQADGRIVVTGAGFDVMRFTTGGALDPTFGTGGVAALPGGRADAVAIQTDGNIVVAGTNSPNPNPAVVVARFDSAGVLDPTFGTGGVATVDFAAGDSNFEGATAVAIQSDGRIVVVGGHYEGGGAVVQRVKVVRLLTNGSLDTGFGTGGVFTAPLDRWSRGQAVALQADGKIVVAGYSYVPYFSGQIQAFLVFRLDGDGALDPGFGSGGLVVDGPGVEGSRLAYGLAIQPDGKIVIGGIAGLNAAALRYLPSGSPDGAFGVDGIGKTAYPDGSTFMLDMVLQPDGRIVLVGEVDRNYGSGLDTALVRFNADGSPDTTLASGGRARIVIGPRHSVAIGAARQSDGKIVITGLVADSTVFSGDSDTKLMVARFGGSCGDGALDAGEDCDDGNNDGFDCCSAGCGDDPVGQLCDTADASLCTYDACDGAGTCVIGGAWPPAECLTPTQAGASSLFIKDNAVPAKDQLKWTWKKGADVFLFGYPGAVTEYAFCLFEGSTLVSENAIAPGLGWRQTSTGWKLKRDPLVTPGGIGSVVLRAGGPGRSRVVLKGRGPLLAPPAVPLATPVTAQLVSSSGDCFEATYTTPLANASGRFKAKGQ